MLVIHMQKKVFEAGLSFGEKNYFEIVKIKQTGTGDVYIIIPFFNSGLHYSLHTSGKAHLKDNKGFRMDCKNLSEIYLTQEDFLSDFSSFLLSSKQRELTVFSFKIKDATKIVSSNDKVKIDILGLMEDIEFFEAFSSYSPPTQKNASNNFRIAINQHGIYLPTENREFVLFFPQQFDVTWKKIQKTKLWRYFIKPLYVYFEENLEIIDKQFFNIGYLLEKKIARILNNFPIK